MLEFKNLSKCICLTFFFVIGHLYVYTIIVAQLWIKMTGFKLNLDLFNYLCITQRPGFLSDVIKVDEQYIMIKVNCCFVSKICLELYVPFENSSLILYNSSFQKGMIICLDQSTAYYVYSLQNEKDRLISLVVFIISERSLGRKKVLTSQSEYFIYSCQSQFNLNKEKRCYRFCYLHVFVLVTFSVVYLFNIQIIQSVF